MPFIAGDLSHNWCLDYKLAEEKDVSAPILSPPALFGYMSIIDQSLPRSFKIHRGINSSTLVKTKAGFEGLYALTCISKEGNQSFGWNLISSIILEPVYLNDEFDGWNFTIGLTIDADPNIFVSTFRYLVRRGYLIINKLVRKTDNQGTLLYMNGRKIQYNQLPALLQSEIPSFRHLAISRHPKNVTKRQQAVRVLAKSSSLTDLINILTEMLLVGNFDNVYGESTCRITVFKAAVVKFDCDIEIIWSLNKSMTETTEYINFFLGLFRIADASFEDVTLGYFDGKLRSFAPKTNYDKDMFRPVVPLGNFSYVKSKVLEERETIVVEASSVVVSDKKLSRIRLNLNSERRFANDRTTSILVYYQ